MHKRPDIKVSIITGVREIGTGKLLHEVRIHPDGRHEVLYSHPDYQPYLK